jgi:hypothetical protein
MAFPAAQQNYMADDPLNLRIGVRTRMKNVAIAFAIGVIVIAAFVTWRALGSSNVDTLQIGNFLALSLTLIVLIWYAHDTNVIARVTQERWLREGVLSTTYSMQLLGDKGQVGRTLFQVHNPSTLSYERGSHATFE